MMKKSLLLLTLGFALLIGLNVKEVAAAQIPLKKVAGTFTVTGGGAFAVCLDSGFAETSCTGGSVAFVFPTTIVQLGEATFAADGSSCFTWTQTISDLPVDISPPMVSIFESVGPAPTSYNPATGVGVASFANYTGGGTCKGATFTKDGGTLTSNITLTFIVSDTGKRIDYIATAFQDVIGGFGDFYFTSVGLR